MIEKESKVVIDYDSYFPTGMIIVGWIISFIGFVLIFSTPLIGLTLIFAGPLLQFVSSGIELDFGKNEYREYMAYYWRKKGTWKTLSDVEYISIFKAKYTQRVNSRTSTMELDIQKIEVQLVTQKSERIFINDFKDIKEAKKLASFLSQKLKLKILDATTSDQKWGDLNNDQTENI